MAGSVILQFAGCRAKCYSIVTDEEQKMGAAGVKRNMQKRLKHVEILCRIRPPCEAAADPLPYPTIPVKPLLTLCRNRPPCEAAADPLPYPTTL